MTWTPGQLTTNRDGLTVRRQVERARIPAAERFAAFCEHVDAGEELSCIVFTGGDTFRVDDDLVTTPIRYAYELVTGESPPANRRFRMQCKTPGCVRLSHVKH